MWRSALHLLAKRIAPLSARSTRRPTREVVQRRGGGGGLYSLGALRGALRGGSAVHSLSPAMRKRLVELLGAGTPRPKSRKSPSTIRSSSRINRRYVSRHSSSGVRDSSKKRSTHRSKKYSQRNISSSRSAEGKKNSSLHSRSKKGQMRRSKSRTVKRRRKSKKTSSAKRASKKVLSIPSSTPSVAPLGTPTAALSALAPDGSHSPHQSAVAATPTDSRTFTSDSPRVPSSAFSSSSEFVSRSNPMHPVSTLPLSINSLSKSTGVSPTYAGMPSSVLGNELASTGSSNTSSSHTSSTSSFLDPPPRINYHLATAVATVVVPAVANEMLEGMRHVVTRAPRDDSSFEGSSKTSGQQMEEYYMASKGPLFATAVIAGTNAVKLSSTILPLCQPVGIQKCSFTFRRRSVPQSVRRSPLPHRVVLRKRATPPSSVVPKRSEYSIIYCFCTVATSERKAGGVEMEALAGATVAATTMYDMLRHLPCSQEDGLMLGESFILAKRGGQSDFIKLLMSEPSPPSPALISPVTAAPPLSTQFNRSPSMQLPVPLQSFSSSCSTPSFQSASVFRREKANAALSPTVEPQSPFSSIREAQEERKKEEVLPTQEASQWKDKPTTRTGVDGEEEREVKVEQEEEVGREARKKEVAPVRDEKSPEAKNEWRESQKRSVFVEKKNGADPVRSLSARPHDRNGASLGRPASSSEEISSPVQEVDNSPSLEQSSWTSTQRSSTANKRARAPAPPVDVSTITAATPSPPRGESPITRNTTTSGDVVSWWQSTPQERRLQEYNPRRRYGEGRLSPITLAEKRNPRGKEKQEKDGEKREEHIVEEGKTEERASSITSSPSPLVSSSDSKRLKRKKVVRIVRKSHHNSLSPQISDYVDDEVEEEDEAEEDQSIRGGTRDEGKLSTERDHISGEKLSNVAPKIDSGEHQKVEKPPVKVEKKATIDSSKRSSTDHGEEDLQDEEVEEESVDSNSEHTLKSTKSTSKSKKESSEGKKRESSRIHSKDKKGNDDRVDSAKEENEEEEYSPVSHSNWDTLTTRIEDDEDVDENRTESSENVKIQEESYNSISSLNDSDEFLRGSEKETEFFKGNEEDDVEDYVPPPPREKPTSLLSKKKKKLRYQ